MARRFVFNLETVLKLRKRKEDRHKRIVAERIRQLNAVRQQVTNLQRQIASETELVRAGRARGTIQVPVIARSRHWLTYLQRSLLEARGHQRGVEGILAQERAELARAAKEAKALEKLKERQKLRHDEEEKRIETKELDEMAILRFRPAEVTRPPGALRGRRGPRPGAWAIRLRE